MIDDIDRRIILELQKDGRRTSSSLSRQFGLSVSLVSRRIKRLLANKVLIITAVPDPRKVGYEAIALIGMDVEMPKIDAVCSRLVPNPNVHWISITFGRYDILITASFRTQEQLTYFIKNELSSIEGVRQVETFYVAELKKRTHQWLYESM